MFTATRLYFTHALTCQLNSFLNDFLSDSVEIIKDAYTKTRKEEDIGFRNTFNLLFVCFFNNSVSSSICKLLIRSEIYNCTVKNTNKVSIIIILAKATTL